MQVSDYAEKTFASDGSAYQGVAINVKHNPHTAGAGEHVVVRGHMDYLDVRIGEEHLAELRARFARIQPLPETAAHAARVQLAWKGGV